MSEPQSRSGRGAKKKDRAPSGKRNPAVYMVGYTPLSRIQLEIEASNCEKNGFDLRALICHNNRHVTRNDTHKKSYICSTKH
jgi:hypothetical protein